MGRLGLIAVLGLACSKAPLVFNQDASSPVDTKAAAPDMTAQFGGDASAVDVKADARDGVVAAPDAAAAVDGTAQDAQCNADQVWYLLDDRVHDPASLVTTRCYPARDLRSGEPGFVVFNDTGRIVDDTAYSAGRLGPITKEQWLSDVAQYRWPCLAGTRLAYDCVSFGD